MPIIAMTKEMGSLGTFIGLEVARQLGYEFVRDAIVKEAAREYRVLEAGLVGALEERPGLLERFGHRGRRYRAYLEAAVLDAAVRGRVLLMGRWSTLLLRGVRHAARVRVCAPGEVRAQRVMKRLGIDHADAQRRIAAYDEGVRARVRQIFDLDWTDPLLYDLVINTEAVTLESGVRQVLALAEAPEFQPTEASRAGLWDRAVTARVRATLKANSATTHVDLDVQAADGQVRLAGVVSSDEEREASLTMARGVPGVVGVSDEIKVFRRPIR
ncbi:MAG: cytidylate kinase family protein [Candidatus Rokuibacteriota bacterium]